MIRTEIGAPIARLNAGRSTRAASDADSVTG
jgi:hypothetical protein